MILNVSIFAWYGAICPWYSFVHNDVVPIYRLIFLAILILLLRRPPIIFALHKKIPQIEETKQALFVGYFGPIGVSAIFYLYTTIEYLSEITVDGVQREDAAHLSDTVMVFVWFMVMSSIVSFGDMVAELLTGCYAVVPRNALLTLLLRLLTVSPSPLE